VPAVPVQHEHAAVHTAPPVQSIFAKFSSAIGVARFFLHMKDDIFKVVEDGDEKAFKEKRKRVDILKDRDNRNQQCVNGSYLHT
jgi:hypothetical protein